MDDQVSTSPHTSIPRSDWSKLVKEIASALQRRDLQAAEAPFKTLWDKAGKWLLFRAMEKGLKREEAEDTVEETFIGFWKILQQGEVVENVAALLLTLLDRRCADYWRKLYGRDNSPIDDEEPQPQEISESDGTFVDFQELPDPLPPEHENVDDADFRRLAMNPLLAAIPPRDRQILMLRHGFELSVGETAQKMQLTEDQVKKATLKSLSLARAQAQIVMQHHLDGEVLT